MSYHSERWERLRKRLNDQRLEIAAKIIEHQNTIRCCENDETRGLVDRAIRAGRSQAAIYELDIALSALKITHLVFDEVEAEFDRGPIQTTEVTDAMTIFSDRAGLPIGRIEELGGLWRWVAGTRDGAESFRSQAIERAIDALEEAGYRRP